MLYKLTTSFTSNQEDQELIDENTNPEENIDEDELMDFTDSSGMDELKYDAVKNMAQYTIKKLNLS